MTTGPEIWKQTEGMVTHLIAACSTGGIISGIGRYLKEQNPKVKILGVDTKNSILEFYHENHFYDTGKMYKADIVGVGKNINTGNLNWKAIDKFICAEKESSLRFTQDLLLQEGIWAGYSSGAALNAAFQIRERQTEDDTVVLVFSDHGFRYLVPSPSVESKLLSVIQKHT